MKDDNAIWIIILMGYIYFKKPCIYIQTSTSVSVYDLSMNSFYLTLFLNESEFICLQRVKWFQVLLFNMINTIYQIFLSNTNNLHIAV